MEQYLMPEGEYLETVLYRHALWLWNTPCYVECSLQGRFTPCIKLPGTISVTPLGIFPAHYTFTSSTRIVCSFEPEYIKKILLEADYQPEPFVRRTIQDSKMQRLILLLMEEIESGAPSGRLYAESLAHALAVRFILSGIPSRKKGDLYSGSSLPKHSLRRVLEFIDQDVSAELSLEALANESGYSRGHFLRMFHRATGMTPHQYVIKKRVDYAMALLKQRESRLADIATACGFSSQAHLTRTFYEHTGVTPGEYRRESREKA
ncbi:AraC family transcriptional regulator [Granulicella sp. dw_53]|uniref:helix-turn-helix domain-containing protein n=1 Tax=Granulicella sp. dw_53 TaxID=2719792 RepID=UPI001BD1C210